MHACSCRHISHSFSLNKKNSYFFFKCTLSTTPFYSLLSPSFQSHIKLSVFQICDFWHYSDYCFCFNSLHFIQSLMCCFFKKSLLYSMGNHYVYIRALITCIDFKTEQEMSTKYVFSLMMWIVIYQFAGQVITMLLLFLLLSFIFENTISKLVTPANSNRPTAYFTCNILLLICIFWSAQSTAIYFRVSQVSAPTVAFKE